MMVAHFSTGRAALAPLFLFLLALAGCASQSTRTSSPPREAPAAVRYNLAGYSASFKQGYGDACASPKRRNDQKYKADADYQMGWNDGQSVCKK
jgi:hypothetical protein